MAITKGAKKAHKQSLTKRVFNLRRDRVMKGALKDIENLVKEGKKDEAAKLLPLAYKAIDKAAKRGIIKDNNAGRKKAKVAKLVSSK